MLKLAEKVRRFSRDQRGFTLVELLVVVAIIGILAATLLPRLLGYTNNARVSRAMGDIASMRSIVEAYAADEGKGYYPVADSNKDTAGTVGNVLWNKGIRWDGAADGVKDPWGNPYQYKTAPNAANVDDQHYMIQSAGPDKTFDNADDVYCTDADAPTHAQPPAQSDENTAWGQPAASAQ